MKRLLATTMAAFLFISGAQGLLEAQIGYGAKGGVSVSNQLGHDSTRDFHPRVSLTGGIFAVIPFGKHSIFQPELIYVMNGTRIDTGRSAVLKWNFSYIHFPMLVKYYPSALPFGFHAFVGPYIGFNLSATAEVGAITENIENTMNPLEVGGVIGLGIEINRFVVDERYSIAYTSNDRTGGLFLNGVLSLMGGYRFR